MGEQGMLDLDILTEAELAVAKEETKKDESEKKQGKTRTKAKKEESVESPEAATEAGDQPTGTGSSEESTGAIPGDGADGGSKSRNAKGSRKGTNEPSLRPDGWNTNIIGEPPTRMATNPYFQGVITKSNIYGGTVLIPFKEIKNASRTVYVDDIHLENPTVIETRYMITGTFLEVSSHVSESEFYEILGHKNVKLNKIFYSYVSCEKTKNRRNYQLINEDRWPTANEIAKMDKELDVIDYALMSYSERQKYKENKEKLGETIEEPEEEDIPEEEIAEEIQDEEESE